MDICYKEICEESNLHNFQEKFVTFMDWCLFTLALKMAKHNECSRFSALYSLASDSSTTLSLLSKSDKILSTNLTQIIPYQVYKNSISLWYHILNTGPKDSVCLAMDPIYVACILWKVTAQPESGQLMLWGGFRGEVGPSKSRVIGCAQVSGIWQLVKGPLEKGWWI